jgi:AAA+ ATPase superfamily predicted ATPase
MYPFIDRIQEMKTLEQAYKKEDSSLIIVYGRRRVGKTTLLTEFIKDKPAIYFLATQEAEAINRSAFQEKVASFTGNKLLSEVRTDKWDTLFKTLIATPAKEKTVIIIDEFQYLGKMNRAFPSVFQRIWDELLKDHNIMVILCGSLISMMVSQTLSYNSPLYGRRTAQIRMRQIPFLYYKDFFNSLSLKELIERYAVTGGVPKYIESFTNCTDIYEGILENILNQSGYLYEEPHFLLQQEVSEIGNYFSILRTIAFGHHKLSEIASAIEVKATDLTRPLKTLMDLDLIEREVPITESVPEKSKKGLYKITDNYIRFWFSFVYPNISDIERGNTDYVLEHIRKGFIKRHAAFIYEDICREQLNVKIPYHFSKIGRYWDKHTEIDIVALNEEENRILFGECKYWLKPVDTDIFYSLVEKSKRVSWFKDKREDMFVLFALNGYTKKLIELAESRSDLLLF